MGQAAFFNNAFGPGHRFDHHRALAPDLCELEPGMLEVKELIEEAKPILGLLVVEGLMSVELSTGRAATAWLVGADDLVRPQQIGDIPLIQGARWRVLTRTQALVLSAGLCERARRSPVVFDHLLACATRTAHWLLARSLVTSLRGVDDRLLLLFALWGERWGRVTPAGIRLELPVTHSLIGECCGTRRPSVTSALGVLHDKGVIVRAGRAEWLLRWSDTVPGTRQVWELATSALGFGSTNGNAGQGLVASAR